MKRFLLLCASIGFASIACTAALAQQPQPQPQQPAPWEPELYDPQVDVRNGGVLEESYDYHQEARAYQSSRPGPYPPKGGWYGYGFPVSTYRWGWFGAERYYPRVGWHNDYNGNCVRFAYRNGY
jgi:hypothetical protein